MDNKLHKLGKILYWIYTLKSESLDAETYSRCCDSIYEALLDIAPQYKPKQIDPYFLDIIVQTNRRLKDAR